MTTTLRPQPPTVIPPALEGIARIEDLGVGPGTRVLVRLDLNTTTPVVRGALHPRITAALPTLRTLTAARAVVTVACHVGDPGLRPVPQRSTAPLAAALRRLLPEVEVLPNLRFDPREAAGDDGLVEQLVRDQDVFVNDAFGAAHRPHASLVGPPRRLPSAMGHLMEQEVTVIDGLLTDVRRPFVAISGGNKVSDKLRALSALAGQIDQLHVGGALAVPFLVAVGRAPAGAAPAASVGRCRALLDAVDVTIPADLLVEAGRGHRRVTTEVAAGDAVIDVGPEAADAMVEACRGPGTTFWNGPVGIVERLEGAQASRRLAHVLAVADGPTIIGGGETAELVASLGLRDAYHHVSTGGGSMLEFLSQRDLVALAALRAGMRGEPT